ncbi:MAG TPA: DUF3048 domain-containing protein [Candidatus Magasanikbacteria bacterium]|nr:DUF3048 domain-containing protein [Candidatus Magasanikbacteria bacterium]
MNFFWKKSFSKTQRYLFLVALFAIVLSLIFVVIFKYNLTKQGQEKDNIIGTEEEKIEESTTSTLSFLNGVVVPLEITSSCAAVMIDNAPEVEKQFGLNAAALVYEAPVEGGRTRFMAVYHLTTSTEQFIGPVRSARPYYLDWVQELNCLYTHVGGSPEALQKIKTANIFDLNEFYNGNYFWRSKNYVAPHSTFTSLENLAAAFEKNKTEVVESEVSRWLFAKTETKDLESGEGFFEEKIGESKIAWQFDQNLKNWKRLVEGKSVQDEEGTVKAKNVVFQYVSAKVLDQEGRLSLTTVGRGKAVILKGSRVIKGTWEKTGTQERTKFFGPDTKEIEFNPGLTWVEIVPQF